MNTRTLMICAIFITLCTVVACKKSDSNTPSSTDKLIGKWKATDQGGQTDVYQFNSGGTGTDTRNIGSILVVNFSWSVDNSDVLDIETKNWVQGNPVATIEGPHHIVSNNGTTLVVKSVNDPNYPARTFARQ